MGAASEIAFERIDEFDLTPERDGELAALIAEAMPPDYGGRSYYQNRHHRRYVARDGKRAVAHLAVALRAVRLGKTVHTVGGIAEVCTLPTHRRQGLATRLLAMAEDDARAARLPFLVLFGTEPIYEAAGYEPKSNDVRRVKMTGVETGITREGPIGALKVKTLGDAAWDDGALLDLCGWPF